MHTEQPSVHNRDDTSWSADDVYYMEQAFAQAHKAMDADEVPVGAVVVHQNTIVGAGYNQPISQCNPSFHAEVQAIGTAAHTLDNYRLPNCTLYVTLEPCIMCCGLIIHARIGRLVFAALEHKTGAVVSCRSLLDATRCVSYQHGLMAQRSQTLLQRFFTQKRKKNTL